MNYDEKLQAAERICGFIYNKTTPDNWRVGLSEEQVKELTGYLTDWNAVR